MLVLSQYLLVDARSLPFCAGGCSFPAALPGTHPGCQWCSWAGFSPGALAMVPLWGQMHPLWEPNLLCPVKFPPTFPPDLGCSPLRHEVTPNSSPQGISGQGLTVKLDPGVTPAAPAPQTQRGWVLREPGTPRGLLWGVAPGPEQPPARAGAVPESPPRGPAATPAAAGRSPSSQGTVGDTVTAPWPCPSPTRAHSSGGTPTRRE